MDEWMEKERVMKNIRPLPEEEKKKKKRTHVNDAKEPRKCIHEPVVTACFLSSNNAA